MIRILIFLAVLGGLLSPPIAPAHACTRIDGYHAAHGEGSARA
jgi:hypothetical protein